MTVFKTIKWSVEYECCCPCRDNISNSDFKGQNNFIDWLHITEWVKYQQHIVQRVLISRLLFGVQAKSEDGLHYLMHKRRTYHATPVVTSLLQKPRGILLLWKSVVWNSGIVNLKCMGTGPMHSHCKHSGTDQLIEMTCNYFDQQYQFWFPIDY